MAVKEFPFAVLVEDDMSRSQPATPSLFTQVDIDPTASEAVLTPTHAATDEQARLLRGLLATQTRTNELLEELLSQLAAPQRQRLTELNHWKQANPDLSRACRAAAESLGRAQTSFLESLAVEVQENSQALLEGDFLLNEFIDRFGPRLAHINGLLQVLSQLGSNTGQASPSTANS